MRGDMAIKELRRMGKKPTQVWLLLLEPNASVPRFVDPEDLLAYGLPPEVYVEATEDINALDWRFLVGTTVHLQSENPDRLRSAFTRLRACRPTRIIASGGGIIHDTQEQQCKT